MTITQYVKTPILMKKRIFQRWTRAMWRWRSRSLSCCRRCASTVPRATPAPLTRSSSIRCVCQFPVTQSAAGCPRLGRPYGARSACDVTRSQCVNLTLRARQRKCRERCTIWPTPGAWCAPPRATSIPAAGKCTGKGGGISSKGVWVQLKIFHMYHLLLWCHVLGIVCFAIMQLALSKVFQCTTLMRRNYEGKPLWLKYYKSSKNLAIYYKYFTI